MIANIQVSISKKQRLALAKKMYNFKRNSWKSVNLPKWNKLYGSEQSLYEIFVEIALGIKE